jgi:hypothetical protein
MDLNLKYRLLDTMGIPIWMLKRSSALMSNRPIWGASLLVLLPEKLPQKEEGQNKILMGMLEVLALRSEELCVAWVDPVKGSDRIILQGTINQWAPRLVLVMGETLAQFLLKINKSLDTLRMNSHSVLGLDALLEVTYHPAALEKFIEHKRKAYQDLLRLKSKIAELKVA